ncbi:MAG: hypothetical protein CL946_09940 [Ectothiorhodospiraceae bacterium]|nr:hypothetical protein [Ectothiorhodospiraceae bacterium]
MRIMLIMLSILLVPALAFAQGDRIGTAAADQVLVPVGAKGIALGASNLAGISGADAIYYNPAGLSASPLSAEVQFSQMELIGDVGVSYLAITSNFGNFGHLGFTLKSFSFGDIDLTTERQTDGTGAVYSPTFLALGVTYSRALTDRIRAGVNINLISEQIDRVSQSGVLFDVGVQYSGLAGLRGLQLGVTLRHLGGNLAYDGPGLYRSVEEVDGKRGQQILQLDAAEFNVPTSLELGLAYNHMIDPIHAVTVASSFENNNFLNDLYRVGVEYSYQDLLFLRGSYTVSGNSEDDAFGENGFIYGPAFGAGVKYAAGTTQLRVDYAYRALEVFSGNHVFTIGVGF